MTSVPLIFICIHETGLCFVTFIQLEIDSAYGKLLMKECGQEIFSCVFSGAMIKLWSDERLELLFHKMRQCNLLIKCGQITRKKCSRAGC